MGLLTGRRTQTIAQKKPRGVYKTYGNGHGPNRKHTFLRHKQRITALVTQQYTATQQVYTRVHTSYTPTQPSIQSLQYQLHTKHHVYNNTARPLGLGYTYKYYYPNKHTHSSKRLLLCIRAHTSKYSGLLYKQLSNIRGNNRSRKKNCSLFRPIHYARTDEVAVFRLSRSLLAD